MYSFESSTVPADGAEEGAYAMYECRDNWVLFVNHTLSRDDIALLKEKAHENSCTLVAAATTVYSTTMKVRCEMVASPAKEGMHTEFSHDTGFRFGTSKLVRHLRTAYGPRSVKYERNRHYKRPKTTTRNAPVKTKAVQSGVDWGLDRIDQSFGRDGTYTYDHTGIGVDLYVVDTGIKTDHQEFGSRASMGFNSVGGTNTDCNGHGTHVSAIAGGINYGVAKDINLIGVKVLTCAGEGSTFSITVGLQYVFENKNNGRPCVINLSLGGAPSTLLDDTLAEAVRVHGCAVSVAAGNDNDNACYYSPAREPSVLTVAASDVRNNKAWFSNYGSCVQLSAPGESIKSAWIQSSDGWAVVSGTSMAAPFVAGVLALVMEQDGSMQGAEAMRKVREWTTENAVSNSRTYSISSLLYSKIDAFANPPHDGGGGGGDGDFNSRGSKRYFCLIVTLTTEFLLVVLLYYG